jgi:hypothetical protein
MGRAKKKAKDEQRTITFVDEAGFYFLPMAVHTYAPAGQTPVLEVQLTRDHLSAIGAITPEGKIVMQTQDHSYKGPDVVRFVAVALARDSRQAAGHLGRCFHSPLSPSQRLSAQRRSQTHASRTLAWLCSPPSIRRKASGICSSASNSRMFVVLTCHTFNGNCVAPKNG